MIAGASTVFATIGKTTVFTQNIADTVADVQGIITGAGAIADGANGIQGIGDVGKKLRYRLYVGKGEKPVAVYDIDEDGGIVLSSESPTGIAFNANKGSLSLFSKLGIKLFGKSFISTVNKVALTAVDTLKLVSGGKMSRAAGSDIADSAENLTQVAEFEAVYGAGTKLKIQCVDATVELTPGNVSVQTGGTVNVTGGTVSITGGTVTIVGATVSIN